MHTPPIRRSVWIKLFVLTLVAALGGLTCVIVPPYLLPGGIQHTYPAPLFPTLRTAWENLAFGPTTLSLFVLGIILGAVQPKFWVVLGVAPVALLPVAALLEGIVDSSSHSLLGVECALYAFIGLASFLGALIGSRCRLRFSTKRTDHAVQR